MDSIEMHRRAQAEFGRVLDHVTDDDLASKSPCDEWTVDDLIGHVGCPFAEEQPCDADRPVADRLAAFLGRRV